MGSLTIHQRSRGAAWLALAVSAFGCDQPPPGEDAPAPEPNFTVRDSAGIEIVENHAPEWPAGEFWAIDSVPEFVLGGSGDAGGLGNTGEAPSDSSQLIWEVVGVARLEDGRVAVLSSGGKQLFLFETSGVLSRTIGREGEGPGEFTRPELLQYLPPDTLVVWDYFLTSIVHFDTSGTLLKERRVDYARLREHGITGEDFRLHLPDGSFIAAAMDTRATDAPADCSHLAGEAETFGGEKLALPAEHRWRIDEDYTAHPLGCASQWTTVMAAGGDPPSVYISTDHSEIQQRSLDGTVLRIIRRTTDPTPATDRARAAELENLINYYEMMGFPELPEGFDFEMPRRRQYPAVEGLVVDSEGYLWVREWSDSESGIADQWSVFDSAGRWLGVLRLPPDPAAPDRVLCGGRFKPPCWIGRDYFLMVRRDQLGVERIEGYRLDRSRPTRTLRLPSSVSKRS